MFYIVLGIFILFAILIGSIILIQNLIERKYKNFVLTNSKAIQDIKRINSNYLFSKSRIFDEVNTYDNENIYNDLLCIDYLIYQLQYKWKEVMNDIRLINDNILKFDIYKKEVNSINSFGHYINTPLKYKIEKLDKIERKIFNGLILNPQVSFSIKVTLRCSNINGNVYAQKYNVFNKEQVVSMIQKLNNRNGVYFKDRDIWDSICKVERAKVTNRMRFSIYSRDGYRCRMCGRSGEYCNLEIDHIKPISKGGKSTYDNLQTLCKECNKRKGNIY